MVIVIAVEGQIAVISSDAASDRKSTKLEVGEGVAFSDGPPTEFSLGAIPSWYRTSCERSIDELAASDMHSLLGASGDVTTKLTAMCDNRRPESAALAIQTSMLLGKWNGFAGDFLRDEAMRNHWSTTLALAEQMLSLDAENVVALEQAFETAHPTAGEKLIGILVGTLDNKQGKELLPKLAESLGSEQLAERVLAWHKLRQLTGKDFGFQPSFPNRASLQHWRREIASNGLELLPLNNGLWETQKPTCRITH